MDLTLSEDHFLEVLNIRDGVLAPLEGFMNEPDYRSVVEGARLASGAPWGLPITFDVPPGVNPAHSDELRLLGPVSSSLAGRPVATLEVESVFEAALSDCRLIFGTAASEHPGVRKEQGRSRLRIGGRLRFSPDFAVSRNPRYRTPAEMKEEFRKLGWRTIIGFQTRNAIHRAHEYLQRIGLEIADGLLIHPLTGWKKDQDASETEIVATYDLMMRAFYPADRVRFSVLETEMRYAGPREALFHAIIRRNYGCTHFIIGRDHAGVGGYYDKYAAQKFCAGFPDVGITIVPLAGPFHCDRCGGIVTERTCAHTLCEPSAVREISGTMMRAHLAAGEAPPSWAMRPEIAALLVASGERKERA